MERGDMQTERPRAATPRLELSEILRRMAQPDLTNVAPIRPACAPRAMTAEEALIAWRLGLPEGADPAAAARDALAVLDGDGAGDEDGGPLAPPLLRLRRYLEQAAEAERPRRGA
jgi:hypothetical protein